MQYLNEILEYVKTCFERGQYQVIPTCSHGVAIHGVLPTNGVLRNVLHSVNCQGIRSAYTSGLMLATCSSTTKHESSGIGDLGIFCIKDDHITTCNERDDFPIKIIEWDMMDKCKFYPFSMLSSFTIRTLLYPFTLVKTKMQIQSHKSIYKNMRDCFSQTLRSEGVKGLYKGFWVSAFQIVSGVFYVSTYEGVRYQLHKNGIQDSNLRALIAGGAASVVGQTCIVPFDVISQHMMIVGMQQTENGVKSVCNPLGINYMNRSRYEIAKDITSEIYRRDGFRGFYRGYLASLGTYVPNSALWWTFYHVYQTELEKVFPTSTSYLIIQCTSAMLGGFTTTLLTNPLDVCRARLQVQRLPSFRQTFELLWKEEKFHMFTKGLSARTLQSGIFSVSIILGYESIKRLSVTDNYRDKVIW